MYEQLPIWLKVPTQQKTKLSMWLQNGSKITAKSSNSDAARSEAVSLLLIDECIDNQRVVIQEEGVESKITMEELFQKGVPIQ